MSEFRSPGDIVKDLPPVPPVVGVFTVVAKIVAVFGGPLAPVSGEEVILEETLREGDSSTVAWSTSVYSAIVVPQDAIAVNAPIVEVSCTLSELPNPSWLEPSGESRDGAHYIKRSACSHF